MSYVIFANEGNSEWVQKCMHSLTILMCSSDLFLYLLFGGMHCCISIFATPLHSYNMLFGRNVPVWKFFGHLCACWLFFDIPVPMCLFFKVEKSIIFSGLSLQAVFFYQFFLTCHLGEMHHCISFLDTLMPNFENWKCQ